MSFALLTVRVQFEPDVVSARQRTRDIAEALGFDAQQQTRLATAVSEIARNALTYGGGGNVEFSVQGATSPQLFSIVICDRGKGIPNVDEILEGRYQSATGMGLGIIGARRLMDQFLLESSPGKGTRVVLSKLLPRRAPLVTVGNLKQIIAALARNKPKDLLDEFREQNQELLRTLGELRLRQDELVSLNRELEDTNRGVVALYAELDERADHLRRADEVKSRFLSNMSHEFRTPLNSILALSRLLLDRTDGDLSSEQEIQVNFIRQSAESLFELVNDLLDLAKVEAGKIVIHPVEFDVQKLFGALRGMLRPLLVGASVNLVFDDARDIPPLYSDEGKVSQILRNFLSNALKFTEVGEIRVSAMHNPGDKTVMFRVKDTGIGIAREHRDTIFQEFTQVDSPIQRKVKGTGLGLPLSRKLAELLGGSVGVDSEVGLGSAFWLRIPDVYGHAEPPAARPELESSRLPVLLIEDHYETTLIYEKYLRSSPWQMIAARSVREAENVLRNLRPVAIVMDIVLQGEDSWDLLASLKSNHATSGIPILVVTTVDDRGKALALGADDFMLKPLTAPALRQVLRKWTQEPCTRSVLLIDDQDVSRYIMKQIFSNPAIRFLEATNGTEGLQIARAAIPDLVVMDLSMPEMNGFDAVESMQADPQLQNIPVLVATSKVLTPDERVRLGGSVLGVLSKEEFSSSNVVEQVRTMLSSADLQDLVPEKADAFSEVRAS